MRVTNEVECPHCKELVRLPHCCRTRNSDGSYVMVAPVPFICANCRHYEPNAAAREHGECMLFPPQLARLEDTWVRPAVMWNHRCGQFSVNTELL